MENASKALLIAGAILIAILLIAIGMMVFNSAKGVIDTSSSNMSDTEKTAFNKQFTIYNGVQSGSNLREIISKVNTNNSNGNNQLIVDKGSTAAIVTCTAKDSDTNPTSATWTIVDIKNQSQYNVQFNENASNGLVESLTITQHN